MTELAAVIAEHSLDNSAKNWFLTPWRSGWNAVELAVRATDAPEDDGWLGDVCRTRAVGEEIYWIAQDRLSTVITPSPMMRAGLRCLQLMLARSDGGGEVYNAVLLGPFSTILPENVADLVMEYRCRDSIGVSMILRSDVNDRLRRAFMTAWKRGLYHAAYSLPSAAPTRALKVIR